MAVCGSLLRLQKKVISWKMVRIIRKKKGLWLDNLKGGGRTFFLKPKKFRSIRIFRSPSIDDSLLSPILCNPMLTSFKKNLFLTISNDLIELKFYVNTFIRLKNLTMPKKCENGRYYPYL